MAGGEDGWGSTSLSLRAAPSSVPCRPSLGFADLLHLIHVVTLCLKGHTWLPGNSTGFYPVRQFRNTREKLIASLETHGYLHRLLGGCVLIRGSHPTSTSINLPPEEFDFFGLGFVVVYLVLK